MQLVSPYLKVDGVTFSEFKKIDDILHKYYLTGQLALFTLKLKDYTDDFHFRLKRKESFVKISFAKTFGSINVFRLHIQCGQIQLTSKMPLVRPQYNQHKRKLYFKRASDPINVDHIREIINISITEKTDSIEILTFMRDAIFYTHCYNMWFLMCRALSITHFSGFSAKLIFLENNIRRAFMILKFFDKNLITLPVSTKDGTITAVPIFFSRPDLKNLAIIFEKGPIEVSDFISASALNLWSIRVTGPPSSLYSNSLPMLLQNVSSISSHTIGLVYSFYRKFKLISIRKPQFIDMFILTDKGIVQNPIVYSHFYNESEETFNNLTRFIQSSKLLLLNLALQAKLISKGYHVTRLDNIMFATLPPQIFVVIKLNDNGSWRIEFDLQSFPFYNVGTISFRGKYFTCRFVKMVVHLFENIRALGLYLNRVKGLSTEAQSFFLENQLSVAARIHSEATIHVSFNKFRDESYTTRQLKSCFHLNTGEMPMFKISLSPYYPLVLSNDPLIYRHQETFGSLLSGRIYPLIELFKVFNTQNWSTTSLDPFVSFSLIYKRKTTFNIQICPTQEFIVIVPKVGPTAVFRLPMSRFKPLYKRISLSHAAYRVKLDQLRMMKTAVEEFYAENMILTKFNFAKQEGDDVSKNVFTHASSDLVATQTVDGLELQSQKYPQVSTISTNMKTFENRRIRLELIVLIIHSMSIDSDVAKAFLFAVTQFISTAQNIDWKTFIHTLSYSQNAVEFLLKSRTSQCRMGISMNNAGINITTTQLSRNDLPQLTINNFIDWLVLFIS